MEVSNTQIYCIIPIKSNETCNQRPNVLMHYKCINTLIDTYQKIGMTYCHFLFSEVLNYVHT